MTSIKTTQQGLQDGWTRATFILRKHSKGEIMKTIVILFVVIVALFPGPVISDENLDKTLKQIDKIYQDYEETAKKRRDLENMKLDQELQEMRRQQEQKRQYEKMTPEQKDLLLQESIDRFNREINQPTQSAVSPSQPVDGPGQPPVRPSRLGPLERNLGFFGIGMPEVIVILVILGSIGLPILIAILIINAKKERVPAQSVQDGKFCSNCGKEIAPNAYVCLGCGVKLVQESSTNKNKLVAALRHPPHESVHKTSVQTLKEMTGRDFGDDPVEWEELRDENRPKFTGAEIGKIEDATKK